MLSKETTDQINKKADDFGFQVPYDGTENFYDKGRVEGYQAGATSWAVWKETAEVLAEALDYLMDGVSGLPALTASNNRQKFKLKAGMNPIGLTDEPTVFITGTGKYCYLWFGNDSKKSKTCFATLSGPKTLEKLARSILKAVKP